MSNGNWVCFDCRIAKRLSNLWREDIPCDKCGGAFKYIGTKIPVPRKQNAKAWNELRRWLASLRVADLQRKYKARVRVQHEIEREIARIRALPANKGRTVQLRQLEKRLKRMDDPLGALAEVRRVIDGAYERLLAR